MKFNRNKKSSNQYDVRQIRNTLNKLGIKPLKCRGQNFVVDSLLIQSIINFGAPTPDENILEIGSGLGALTDALYPLGLKGIVEIEDKFCAYLRKKYPTLFIMSADASQIRYSALVTGELGITSFYKAKNISIFSNLPYSASTDICFNLFSQTDLIKRAVLLLQKEFAERLAADPGSRDYGALSIQRILWANVRLGPVFEGNVFYPEARVKSRLVELQFLSKPRYIVKNPIKLKEVIKASFFQRRKKIINSLLSANFWSIDDITKALEAAGIDPSCRAETVSVEQFIKLTNALSVNSICC